MQFQFIRLQLDKNSPILSTQDLNFEYDSLAFWLGPSASLIFPLFIAIIERFIKL